MKPALLTVHDARYEDIAKLSEPTVYRFAKQFDLDPVVKRFDGNFEFPNLAKVQYTLAELEAGREFIVYADTDIKFASHPSPADFIERFRPFGMAVSEDAGGLCVGFFTVRNCAETLRFFRIWAALGYSDGKLMEQHTFEVLRQNFLWVRQLLTRIPQDMVSNPDCPKVGSIAHHFWARATCRADVIKAMGG